MKSYLISLLILFSSFPSHAMLVRAVQPIAKRVIARLLTPKVAPQKTAQGSVQLATRTTPKSVMRPQSLLHTPHMKLFKARTYYRPHFTKPSWLLPAGVSALYASTLNRRAYAEPIVNQTKPWAAVEERYRKELAEEERIIIKNIQEFLNLTPEEWEQKKEKFLPKYVQILNHDINVWKRADPRSVPTELKKIIIRVLQQEDINPDTVIFISDPDTTMAAAGGTLINKLVIFVNEELCTYYLHNRPLELEWIIVHEIQHLKHNDHFMRTFVRTIGTSGCLLNLSTFHEKRADILAGLAASEYAQAAAGRYKNSWDAYTNWYSKLAYIITYMKDPHSYHYTRVTYMNKLHHEMHAPNNRKN